MLRVEQLRKSYGSRQIIEDLSFTAEKGKVYAFLGPNGVGKSTTMNMITGYLAPDGGDILIDDISLCKEPQRAKKKIGYLPEVPPLYPDMTVTEYLGFVAELRGLFGKERKKEVERVSELTSLNYVKQHLIRQISKGYRQRVGLAQALIADPGLIILDEPSSGLDPKQIVEMRELIRGLKEDHTVIFSTHILGEAASVCDHVLILSGGKLVADDTPEHLVLDYNEQQRLTLVLKGSATAAEQAMDKLEGIESHRVVSEDADSCTIEVNAKRGEDIREKISKACIGAGYTILEMMNRKVTLEEVYLELTFLRPMREKERERIISKPLTFEEL
ncbi:MAG: ABC transporter ATP-binding protein [Lachnospiraceae bacterium]|nr:ABC transporter ATP-binding protein [Lachnospiraceae bacterium]